jgi:hypothetical protein
VTASGHWPLRLRYAAKGVVVSYWIAPIKACSWKLQRPAGDSFCGFSTKNLVGHRDGGMDAD